MLTLYIYIYYISDILSASLSGIRSDRVQAQPTSGAPDMRFGDELGSRREEEARRRRRGGG